MAHAPASIAASDPAPHQIHNLNDLPVLVTLPEVARLFRVQEKTIRNKLSKGTFYPKPIRKYPYLWLREDIIRALGKPDLPRRAHGFAAHPATAKRRREPR